MNTGASKGDDELDTNNWYEYVYGTINPLTILFYKGNGFSVRQRRFIKENRSMSEGWQYRKTETKRLRYQSAEEPV